MRDNYVEPTPEQLERAYRDGQRAIRELERERARTLYDPRPNWVRDRNKGAQGD